MSIYASVILGTPGLLSYWRLGETAGTNAVDSGPSGSAGTYTGTFTLSQTGALVGDPDLAVLIDGATGCIRSSQITLPTSITFEAWASAVSNPSNAAFVGQWQGNQGSMLYSAGGSILMWVNGGNITVSAPSTGAYHYLVGTYDGTNAAIYIDGSLAVGPSALTGPIVTPAVHLDMGTYSDAGGGFLNGTLDEIAVYNVALSAAQISDHYAAAQGTNLMTATRYEEPTDIVAVA